MIMIMIMITIIMLIMLMLVTIVDEAGASSVAQASWSAATASIHDSAQPTSHASTPTSASKPTTAAAFRISIGVISVTTRTSILVA